MNCKARISAYYFITEIGFFLVTLWAFFAAPHDMVYPSIGLGWLLFLLARIDFERFILPDSLNLSVAVLAIWILPFTNAEGMLNHLVGCAIGYGLLRVFDAVYTNLRGHAGLGRGDAKLLGALGLWVGLTGLPSLLLIASLTGIAIAMMTALLTRQKVERRSVIAFGPWLALGGWITWLYGTIPLHLFR